MVILDLKVHTKAKQRDALFRDGYLHIYTNIPPVSGKANAEIVQIIAKLLHLPKSSFKIVQGEFNKTKRLQIETREKSDKVKIIEKLTTSWPR